MKYYSCLACGARLKAAEENCKCGATLKLEASSVNRYEILDSVKPALVVSKSEQKRLEVQMGKKK